MTALQPNSRHCFVCGLDNPFGLHLRFYTTAPGEVAVETTVPERFQGYPGVVHGGIIAAMLDEVTGRALMGDPHSPRFMYTARLDVHYRKNVPVGKPIRLVGKVGRVKNRSATASGFIYNQAGELLAEAEAVLVDIPQEVMDQTNLAELGWKVYPLEEL